jgi:hypothetical protein
MQKMIRRAVGFGVREEDGWIYVIYEFFFEHTY